jgi:hypothetical protein
LKCAKLIKAHQNFQITTEASLGTHTLPSAVIPLTTPAIPLISPTSCSGGVALFFQPVYQTSGEHEVLGINPHMPGLNYVELS